MTGQTKLPDADLVEKSRNGDHNAYKALVTRYQGHVYGLAYSLVGNWHDAQDIAQETFIRVYTNLDQLREPARFAAWLRRVTFGVTIDWLRTFRPKAFELISDRVDLETLEIPEFQPTPSESAEKRELADAVLAAVAALPPKYRVPLTMFHLDGLSYKKVADFLDIPLGTAKSLIARARAKLKAALASAIAGDLDPVVKEVFSEYKLDDEFAEKILQGVPSLRWEKTECTFAGAVLSCMQFLEEPVSYDFIMGVSGGAFRLFWHREWCPSSGDLMLIGLEPARRTFRALGYEWEQFDKDNSPGEKELFRTKISESIDRGRPVLATGIIGPPEHGLVTGYDGDALVGWSFFQENDRDYYRKPDWYESAFDRLIVIGDKKPCPSRLDVLREALEWAIEVARLGEIHSANGARYDCGLAAYDEWAAALLRGESFPAGDIETLTSRCNVSTSVVLANLRDARAAAAGFLKEMADVSKTASPEILAAAQDYDREAAMARDIMRQAPFCTDAPERRLQMSDRTLRETISRGILAAKSADESAISHLENALKALGARKTKSSKQTAKRRGIRK